MFNFLKTEITRTYKIDNDDKIMNEKRHKVYTFALIPIEVEKVEICYVIVILLMTMTHSYDSLTHFTSL